MKTITFQGADGAYSELAGLTFFNRKIKPKAVTGFEEVFRAVEKGKTDFGIVPIENSLAGSIHQNYDLLLKYPVWICGEIKLRIRHNLIVNPGTPLKNIRKVYSHPQGLAQCQRFLKTLGEVEQLSFGDTAGAVKFIRDEKMKDAAAIASSIAARNYGMSILRSSIEDNPKNFTRFVILSRRPVRPQGKAKTSLVFALKNVPGVLWKSLSVFAIQDLDLYKIESRPIPGSPWQYIFYLDLSGNIFDSSIKKAVDHLGEITTYLKVLGSYPLGREVAPSPRSIRMKRIPMEDLIRFGAKFLVRRGLSEGKAHYLSRFVVETEAFRSTTHGVAQFRDMNFNLGKKVMPDTDPKVLKDQDAMAVVDGDQCLGQLSMRLAVELGVQKARAFGVAFIGIRNTYWVGALGSYLISIAEQGFLSQAFAQTSSCRDCAPVGGIDARFSTNPVALCFPMGKRIVLSDFSTASYSMAAASNLLKNKEKAAVPRFIDSKGNATNDPSVINQGGSIMFAGLDLEGHKFYGLSLFIEALTAMVGGSANNPEAPHRQTVTLLVLNPDTLGTREYYEKEMKRFAEHVKSSHLRPGYSEIRFPGDRGFSALDDAKKNGVPLDDTKLAMLEALGKETNVKIPW